MIFSAADYDTLAAIVFRPDYPGYATARGVVESPNGDGALDTQKRYSHVATKYIHNGLDAEGNQDLTLAEYTLLQYLRRAHEHAMHMAAEMDAPFDFAPSFEHGALRVLEYPAGATSAEHTDFDLFTLNLYRNVPNPGLPVGEVHMGELGELLGMGHATPHSVAPMTVVQQSLIYFAIPDHSAVLPSGQTVGEWIAERMNRSRYDAKAE